MTGDQLPPHRQWVRSRPYEWARGEETSIAWVWRFHDGRKVATIQECTDGVYYTARVAGDNGEWHRAPFDSLEDAKWLAEMALEDVEVFTIHWVEDGATTTYCGLPDSEMKDVVGGTRGYQCEACLQAQAERSMAVE